MYWADISMLKISESLVYIKNHYVSKSTISSWKQTVVLLNDWIEIWEGEV